VNQVHESAVIYFDNHAHQEEGDCGADHVEVPAEVCMTCSDPEAGRWVPVSFCPQAHDLT
jgi:hypothetical protein